MNKKPTEILSEEHKNILKVIDALEKECNEIEDGKGADKVFFTKVIDFIKNYADKFHHAKEEDILFKEMQNTELHCDPTQQMLFEHEQGRKFVMEMERGIKENNDTPIIENARNYCYLLKEHIYKEDNILYPMADEVFNSKMQSLILVKFREAEKKRFRNGTKEKYLSFVRRLK